MEDFNAVHSSPERILIYIIHYIYFYTMLNQGGIFYEKFYKI
jgi:hypothetical protein